MRIWSYFIDMLFVLSILSFSFPTCSNTINPPQGISSYEFDLEQDQTFCFSSDRHFYAFINNFENCVVSSYYMESSGSKTALETVFFDSFNSSATSPFIDFGEYYGMIAIYATANTKFRLHSIVLENACEDEIIVSNIATDTFYFTPTGNNQCVFPFPICDTISTTFDVAFSSPNDTIDVFMLDNEKISIQETTWLDFSVPFYIIVNASPNEQSHIRFTFSGERCTQGTKRISSQIESFSESFGNSLTTSEIIGITAGGLILILAAAILIVCLVISKKDQLPRIIHGLQNMVNHDNNTSKAMAEENKDFDTEEEEEEGIEVGIEEASESDFVSVDPEIENVPSYFYVNDY